MIEFFDGLRDTLLAFLQLHQYKAMALLIAVEEAGIPLPLPGDLVIAFMGYQVYLGRANPVSVVLITVGSATLGASILYWVCRLIGGPIVHRFGGILHLTPQRQERIEVWFDRFGAPVIILGRLIPGLRVAVAAAAGLARVNFPRFLLYTAVSATLWASFYLGFGWAVGREHKRMETVVHRLTRDPFLGLGIVLAVAALAALAILYRVRRRQKRPSEGAG